MHSYLSRLFKQKQEQQKKLTAQAALEKLLQQNANSKAEELYPPFLANETFLNITKPKKVVELIEYVEKQEAKQTKQINQDEQIDQDEQSEQQKITFGELEQIEDFNDDEEETTIIDSVTFDDEFGNNGAFLLTENRTTSRQTLLRVFDITVTAQIAMAFVILRSRPNMPQELISDTAAMITSGGMALQMIGGGVISVVKEATVSSFNYLWAPVRDNAEFIMYLGKVGMDEVAYPVCRAAFEKTDLLIAYVTNNPSIATMSATGLYFLWNFPTTVRRGFLFVGGSLFLMLMASVLITAKQTFLITDNQQNKKRKKR